MRTTRFRRTTLAAAAGWILAGVATAAPTQSWIASSEEDFARGQLEGTALDTAGRVVLAPRLDEVWGPGPGVVWEIAALDDGGVAVAMSGPGRLAIVPGDGGEEIHHEVPDEGMVTALTRDPAGALLFGVSPTGVVHRVAGDGDAKPLLETGAKFVWALAADTAGDVWIGTGLPGGLWRARPGGELESVYESGDDPVRCIAPLPGGGVVFGTGGEGRVIRVDDAGELFVLFDADEKEVVALTVDAAGRIHALTADSSKQVQSGPLPLPAGSMRVIARPAGDNGNGGDGNGGNGNGGNGGDDDGGNGEAAGAPAPVPVQQFRTGAGGALYRLEAAGARRLWETVEAMPFDMILDDGSHLVATGDQGHLIRVDAEGRAAVVARLASKQASALARGKDGSVLVAGTTDARVARLASGTLREGIYRTPAIDAARPAEWGRVRWSADLPRGAKIEWRIRSGNTDEPDSTWSPWSSLDAAGSARVPAARWLEIEAALRAGRGGSPALRRIEVDYRPANRAPTIRSVEVQPPGVVWEHATTQTANRLGPLVADDPVARATAATLTRMGMSPVRKGYETGARTVSWMADDADGDRLLYTVQIRPEGGDRWHTIAERVDAGFHSWDARSYPSGNYRVRVLASDDLDNADGRQRSDERTSSIFAIDNDRPRVEELRASRAAAGVEIAFVAADPGGRVRAAEVRIDGGPWRPLEPLDGIADSEREPYRVVLPDAPETGSIQVRVTDSGGNLGGAFRGL